MLLACMAYVRLEKVIDGFRHRTQIFHERFLITFFFVVEFFFAPLGIRFSLCQLGSFMMDQCGRRMKVINRLGVESVNEI